MKLVNTTIIALSLLAIAVGLYVVYLTGTTTPLKGQDVYLSYKLNLSVQDTCKILDCSMTAANLIAADTCQQPLSIVVLKMANNNYYVEEVLCG